MKRLAIVLSAWLLVLLSVTCLQPASPAPWTPAMHAHNDYLHERPLVEALEQGFDSVEVDVHLRGSELLVGHDAQALTPTRTLESLYLRPLASLHAQKRLRPMWLLVDIKSTEAVATVQALERILAPYTSWIGGSEADDVERPVRILLTGNRPRDWVLETAAPWLFMDGQLGDLGVSHPRIPWVSLSWRAHFAWTGTGVMTAHELARLRAMAVQAQRARQQLRFWGGPDTPAAWAVLRACGVQRIGTDHLATLSRFLQGP